jgi:hypothetical protein
MELIKTIAINMGIFQYIVLRNTQAIQKTEVAFIHDKFFGNSLAMS